MPAFFTNKKHEKALHKRRCAGPIYSKYVLPLVSFTTKSASKLVHTLYDVAGVLEQQIGRAHV